MENGNGSRTTSASAFRPRELRDHCQLFRAVLAPLELAVGVGGEELSIGIARPKTQPTKNRRHRLDRAEVRVLRDADVGTAEDRLIRIWKSSVVQLVADERFAIPPTTMGIEEPQREGVETPYAQLFPCRMLDSPDNC